MKRTLRLFAVGLLFAPRPDIAWIQAQGVPGGRSTRPAAALEVPYLPQSVLLCGGAALAMVERWWGRRGVYAEDFVALVDRTLGGIRTGDLAAAARARGWDTRAGPGTPDLVRQSIRAGVPVVALIEVARERYHFVVVLNWTDARVTYHDPAVGPSITLDEDRFLHRWTGADRWAMVVRPVPSPANTVASPASSTATGGAAVDDSVPDDSMPCPPWLDLALDAVAADRLGDAAEMLLDARRICPTEPVILRELAGVRFKQRRHREVIALVTEYLELAPGDPLGWQLLATSRYLTGDQDGALEAWNQVGRPIVDLVRIDGTRAIRFRGIAAAIAVPHGSVLTPSRLALARRRVSAIPALRGAAVDYQPVPGGTVEVRAAVAERQVLGRPWRLAAAGAIRALAQRELGLEVASPTGAGELWAASWRWDATRPRAAVRVDLPATFPFPGVVALEGTRERFRFALDPTNPAIFEETRRSALLDFGGWVTAAIRPSAAVRLERWSENRAYLALALTTELRARGDRFALTAMGERAAALSSHPSYTRGGARAMWASSLGLDRAAWSTRLGVDWVSADAPLGVWPAAGGNLSWAIPLRADRQRGLLPGRRAGRAIVHAGLAGDHPLHRFGPVILAVGTFLDGADIVSAADGSTRDRFYLDGGVGIRVGLIDAQLGVLRIDLAKGLLSDGRSALTVGVQRGWPLFQQQPR